MAGDGHVEPLVELFGLLVDDEQDNLVFEELAVAGAGVESLAYTLHHLLVILVGYVRVVDLDDAVAFAQTGRLGRRAGVHLADLLAHLGALRVQVEAVALEVRPLLQVTQARHDSQRLVIALVACVVFVVGVVSGGSGGVFAASVYFVLNWRRGQDRGDYRCGCSLRLLQKALLSLPLCHCVVVCC